MSALLSAAAAVLAASAVILKWTLALVLVTGLWFAIAWAIDRIRQVREARAQLQQFVNYRAGLGESDADCGVVPLALARRAGILSNIRGNSSAPSSGRSGRGRAKPTRGGSDV